MKVRSKKNRNEGFTLLELIIVMSIMAILVSIAVPNFSAAIRQGREAVLRENLFTLRKVISEYEVDKQKHPQSRVIGSIGTSRKYCSVRSSSDSIRNRSMT